jgi:hypothetical protein
MRFSAWVIVLEFIFGDSLMHWMPAFVQPLHLLLANVFVGLVFYLLMHINNGMWVTQEEILEKK